LAKLWVAANEEMTAIEIRLMREGFINSSFYVVVYGMCKYPT
jgi:hypothetical protein